MRVSSTIDMLLVRIALEDATGEISDVGTKNTKCWIKNAQSIYEYFTARLYSPSFRIMSKEREQRPTPRKDK